jgi:hypothetical protein
VSEGYLHVFLLQTLIVQKCSEVDERIINSELIPRIRRPLLIILLLRNIEVVCSKCAGFPYITRISLRQMNRTRISLDPIPGVLAETIRRILVHDGVDDGVVLSSVKRRSRHVGEK